MEMDEESCERERERERERRHGTRRFFG